MSDAPVAAAVAANDIVQVLQSGGIVLATAGQFWAIPLSKTASLADAVTAITSRVAALEGKASPNVQLAGSLPLASVQIGSTDISVPVTGLLRTDTVTVEIEADLPAGVDLRAMHPARDRDGVLIVQAVASLQVSLTAAAVPLRIVALR